jgi:hypothetical protein
LTGWGATFLSHPKICADFDRFLLGCQAIIYFRACRIILLTERDAVCITDLSETGWKVPTMIMIFDLDHTVIDSSHRQLTLPDGSLDLAHWIENCTREKIFGDSLLPLADVMRRYYAEGHTVVVCTARVVSQHDLDFLAHHGLHYHHFLSRDSDEGDATLKTRLLNTWAEAEGLPDDWRRNALMFDDNVRVIEAMMRDRLFCFNAIKYNRKLAA